MNYSKRQVREVGKQFTYGVVYASFVVIGLIAILGFLLTPILETITPRDATDSAYERSGMRLYTDHGTGCQYLATKEGHLSPRLHSDGAQVCGGDR